MSPLRILDLAPLPVATWAYSNVSRGGGFHTRDLSLLWAQVEGLPSGLEGLLVGSDLQGMVLEDGPDPRPLGEYLAAQIQQLLLSNRNHGFPDPSRVGVLLGGDLHVDPGLERRGVPGDVRPCWRAFRDRFRWVAGVPGNHDRFGVTPGDLATFRAEERVFFLDGDQVVLDGLRIGGVGGVFAEPPKSMNPGLPFHRSFQEQVRRFQNLGEPPLQVLLLHQGPRLAGKRFPGSHQVTERLQILADSHQSGSLPLVLGGHRHWQNPKGEFPRSRSGADPIQVLGCDGRMFLLTATAPRNAVHSSRSMTQV